ncbi:dynein regulatory complex subunit 2-like [Apis cerana]|uniref:Dynein regulatory complex subunit 2 n=1 Tax=Apis cerana cerana TaxID=94128 RepID=A0A2A3E3D0_APICC|nr:dynein regulatory complex subunit 2-like [Apis cerana]PBC25802.1 Coiled-coil domain-containing protein [Apis cerana cerana]
MGPKRKRGKRARKPVRTAQELKKEAFSHELKLSTLNTKRYQSFWREMLTRIKMPDIYKKIDIIWQTLEHVFDLKDYSISLLLDSLQDAEDQRRRANGAHIEIFNRSLEAHEARLADIDNFFHQKIKTALADKIFTFENINYHRNQKETILRKINLFVNQRGENIANIARSTAFSRIDAFVEDGDNEKRTTITLLQRKLENLWNNLRNVYSDYRKNTEMRRKDYEIIKNKDHIDQQIITKQYLRIANLLDEIMKYRNKIKFHGKESGNELEEILRESNFFHNIYRETNERFILGHKKDKHRTMTMCKEYNHSVKHMKALMVKAERILAYIQMCRKYETQDEKILPIINSHPMQLSLTDDNDIIPIQMITKDFEQTINFWRRLGFAQLITAELQTQKDKLLMQANDLRKLVKDYLADQRNST